MIININENNENLDTSEKPLVLQYTMEINMEDTYQIEVCTIKHFEIEF